MAYEPKLDPNAVIDGYMRTNPQIKGEVSGYIYGNQVQQMAESIKKNPR